jgi:hypothetical protein
MLDNLRLNNEYIKEKNNIDLINKNSSEIGQLIFVSDYYSDASHFVWEKEGFFQDNLIIKYFVKIDDKEVKDLNIDEAIVYTSYKDPYYSVKPAFNKYYHLDELSKKVFIVKSITATSLSRDKINLVPRNYHLKYCF